MGILLFTIFSDLGGYFSHQKHGHLMHKVHDSLLMDAVTSASRASMDAGNCICLLLSVFALLVGLFLCKFSLHRFSLTS